MPLRVLRGAQDGEGLGYLLRTLSRGAQNHGSHGLGYKMWCEIPIMTGFCARISGGNGPLHAGFMHIGSK